MKFLEILTKYLGLKFEEDAADDIDQGADVPVIDSLIPQDLNGIQSAIEKTFGDSPGVIEYADKSKPFDDEGNLTLKINESAEAENAGQTDLEDGVVVLLNPNDGTVTRIDV
jgi:hypothetical protein